MAATDELIKLAAGVVFQQVATPYRAALERRIIGAAVCGALALIAVIVAAACGAAAFCIWLAPKLGAAQAALVAMGILLVFAIVFALIAGTFARRAPTKAFHDVFDSKQLGELGKLTKVFEGRLPELIIAAAIGGLVFGMRRRK